MKIKEQVRNQSKAIGEHSMGLLALLATGEKTGI
jgi:hypothetical protein